MRKETTYEALNRHPLWAFVFLALVTIAIWLLVSVAAQWTFDHALPRYVTENLDHRGQFGDMFGAVNALFSALALAGVVTAIWHQRDDLVAQIKADQRLERQRQSILLFERWNSDEFYKCRILVRKICEAKKDATHIDTDEMSKNGSSQQANSEEIFRILHFFELWGRLVEASVADEDLVRKFLGSHARNWNERLISKLFPKEGEVEWVSEKMAEGLYFDHSKPHKKW